MKRLFFSIIFVTVLTVFPACNNENDAKTNNNQLDDIVVNENDNNNGAEVEENINNDDPNEYMIKKMEQTNYNSFELEVDYPNDKEYEAEIKIRNNIVKAELEDELNGVELHGLEAFDHIFPIVEMLKVDRNTGKQEAINDVLKAFNLASNYQKLELEIVLTDGMKIEFKDKK